MSLIQSHALATSPISPGTLAAIYKRHGYTLAQAYVLIFGRAPRKGA